jgi:hypothetical protein
MVLKKNGANWDPVGLPFDSDVYALDTHYGLLVCGGAFVMSISPIDPLLDHVAQFDGSAWSMLGDGLDATVYDLHSFNADLYAGGECRVDSLPTFGLARLGDDVATWEHLMPNQTGYLNYFDGACRINTIDDANGEVYVGGAFTMPGMMFYGNNLMRFWGVPDAFDAWALNDGAVLDIAQRNDQLVMAGAFQNDQFSPVPYIGSTDLPSAIGEPTLPVFSVSPNPADDHLLVRIDGPLRPGTMMDVLDASGRVVLPTRAAVSKVTRLDVAALTDGTYLLRLTTSGRASTRSFLKR